MVMETNQDSGVTHHKVRLPPIATKRTVVISGHKTSVSLEPEFWSALGDVAGARGLTRPSLISEIEGGRHEPSNLSSAIRVHVLAYYRQRAMAAVAAMDSPGSLPAG